MANKLKWSAADRIQIQRTRDLGELAGWHSSQIDFMLTQVIKPPQWPAFLGHYLRGLMPELRAHFTESLYLFDNEPVREAVDTALNIIIGE